MSQKKVQPYIKHRYNCCTKPASDPAYIAENVLNRVFTSDRPNEKWLTDVSEFNMESVMMRKRGNILKCHTGFVRKTACGL